MPSKSKKQHYFMEAVANNPAFARKADVPQSVGREFVAADKGHKFSKGGEMKKKMMGKGAPADMPMPMRRPMSRPMPPAMPPGGDMAPPAPPMGMKKGGMTKMAAGGMPMKDGKPAFIGDGKGAMKHGGSVKKMSSGGSASSRADGCATKGKTKGTQVRMAGGGKC
jgi:hypothetical protein